MKRIAWLLPTAIVLALVVYSLLVAGDEKKAETVTPEAVKPVAVQVAQIDKPAPDFTLIDTEGKTHKLSDYLGKVVVLEWINFDCPFVKKHYSVGNMQQLQQSYQAKGAVWFSICSSAPGQQGHFPLEDLKKRIATEKAVPTAYLVDADGTVGRTYGAKTTPHMYIIDAKGILRYAGAIDDTPSARSSDIETSVNYVSGALDAILAGKTVAVKSSVPYGCSVKYKD